MSVRTTTGTGGKRESNSIIDRFFDHYYRRRPVNATFTGIHDYDSQLPDWSPEGLEATAAEMVDLRNELNQLLPADTGPDSPPAARTAADIDNALADAYLDIQLAEQEGPHFLRGNPSLYIGEAVFAAVSLMLRDFAPAADRASALERRLAQTCSLLRDARATIGNHPVPSSWLERALEECDGAVELFGDGLSLWCSDSGLGANTFETLDAAASGALAAVEEFRSWLRSRSPAPESASGAGCDFFELVLKRGHWEYRTSTQLLTQARDQFEEADRRLAAMAGEVDPDGWPAVSAKLEVQHPGASEYLDAFDECWEACRNVAEERGLVTWPHFPIRYVQTPRWARKAAPFLYFLNYRSPAVFDDLEPHDYLTPSIDEHIEAESLDGFLRGVNNSVIKLNHVVHHGALGHHVQNYCAKRSRSRIGRVAAIDCASRIGMFCGGSLAEGWACYATDLMGEVGFLTDLEMVAEQHSRLRQLARAIADIELHQHSWTEGDARRFYRERIGMSERAAAKEVTRTSMFPGTAVMYWLGTRGIHDLRSVLQRTEGAEFSLRSFHDRFLGHGSIPVQLIARLMTENIRI